MDHVAGFDALLRLRLHRPRPLTIIGPEGFVRQTENRLGAFTWNLLDRSSIDFRLTAREFDGREISVAAEFRAREAFRRRDVAPGPPGESLVLAEDGFVVEAVALDHSIPSLAFALQESLRVNVWRSALDELGLPVGPWLDAAKVAVRAGAPDDAPVEIPRSRHHAARGAPQARAENRAGPAGGLCHRHRRHRRQPRADRRTCPRRRSSLHRDAVSRGPTARSPPPPRT